MKAAYINECGPPENIVYGELPDPTPTAGQVLVRTGAVTVNPIDTYVRGGLIPDLPFPYVLGCDLAGVVEAIGPGASQFNVGDRVWGTNQGLLGRQGTFSELCAVDEKWLYPTPDGVDDKTAVACSLVGITAHLGLFRDAKLSAGETLFVNGGSGGVGSMIVQMAKAVGARVITTAGTDEKVEICKSLGADEVVNYKTGDISAAVQKFAPEGVNVVWETHSEPDLDALVSYLSDRGRLVLMAGRNARPEFPVGPFYVKCCSVHGFVMFKASPEEQRVSALEMNRWLVDGKLKARIGKEMPLAEAAEAHRLQEANTKQGAGTLAGKIVLIS